MELKELLALLDEWSPKNSLGCESAGQRIRRGLMNASNRVLELQRRLKGEASPVLLEKWIPDGFGHEPLEHRLMRGLMNANACVSDLQLCLNGKQPIRPLESYPL